MNHYKNKHSESIEVMHDYMSYEEFLGFLLGNVYKYIHRHKHKDDPEGDIEKAIVYLKAYQRCMSDHTIRNPFYEKDN